MSKNKIGYILTGAGSLIAQELALLENLDKGENKNAILSIITGASSGSLNLTGMNAIKSGNIDWKVYIDLICKKIPDALGRFRIITPRRNTKKLKKFLKKQLKNFRFRKLGDLDIDSIISVCYTSKPVRTYYLSSNDQIYKRIDSKERLLDVLMASSAIPVVLQPQYLSEPGYEAVFPAGYYKDGGSEYKIPWQGVLDWFIAKGSKEEDKLDRLYVISAQRWWVILKDFADEIEEITDLHKEFKNHLHSWIKELFMRKFEYELKALKKANKVNRFAYKMYYWVPELVKLYNPLNFKNEAEQYQKTKDWIKAGNRPIQFYPDT